jgi:hypothetical protein
VENGISLFAHKCVFVCLFKNRFNILLIHAFNATIHHLTRGIAFQFIFFTSLFGRPTKIPRLLPSSRYLSRLKLVHCFHLCCQLICDINKVFLINRKSSNKFLLYKNISSKSIFLASSYEHIQKNVEINGSGNHASVSSQCVSLPKDFFRHL